MKTLATILLAGLLMGCASKPMQPGTYFGATCFIDRKQTPRRYWIAQGNFNYDETLNQITYTQLTVKASGPCLVLH